MIENKISLKRYRNYRWIAKDERNAGGVLSIYGTGITVTEVFECLAAGMTPDEISKEYPGFPIESLAEVRKLAAEMSAIRKS